MVDVDGDGDTDMSNGEETDLNPLESRPGKVDFGGTGVRSEDIKQVVAGDNGTWIVTWDGNVYGWGSMRVCYIQLFSFLWLFLFSFGG